MLKGYMGTLLRVDLSRRKISVESLNEEYAKDYIGGSGIGVRMAYDEVPPETDSLSADAKMFFMTGPVTGTKLGSSGRFQVVFKSPLTGILCDCSSGGHWGAHLKKSGYDGLIIEGKSEHPVYLRITDENAELLDASGHWGKNCYQVQTDIQVELKEPKTRVLAIGKAGENQVSYAALINDEGRAAARGGPGAVMGSKNLKAIAVFGRKEVELYDREKFHEVAMSINKTNKDEMKGMLDYGTMGVHDERWPISDIPVKNWMLPSSEEACVSIGGKKLREELMPFNTNSCWRCTIRCGRWVRIEDGPYSMDSAGPEYESSAALGSLCMVDDIKAMSYANHLCNVYGLDTISTGATIAFAMECMERGILTKEDLGGLDLHFGNKDAVIEAITLITERKGAGILLSLGTRALSEKLGKGSADFAVQVKGLELPMHDPRTRFSWASTYATSSRGGCHLHGMSDTWEDAKDPLPEWDFIGDVPSQSDERKAELTILAQRWGHIRDSIVMCHFATVLFQPSIFSNLIKAATGQTISSKDLMVIGDRINALYRVYNNRCGITAEDDTLPKRALEPLEGGGADGLVPDLKRQLREYYALRGWESDGRPSKRTLIDLGLGSVIEDIY